MLAGIICQTIEREVDFSNAKKKKKKMLFWLLFSGKSRKPVKLGHYSVLRPRILRLLLTLYGKMT